jgi:hypothetical protein
MHTNDQVGQFVHMGAFSKVDFEVLALTAGACTLLLDDFRTLLILREGGQNIGSFPSHDGLM